MHKLTKSVFRRFPTFAKLICGRMSTFVAVVNPVTGKSDWVLQNDDYDYHQEIARSAYADMLHDTERNHKYYVTLEKAVQIMRSKGQQVHVLDIGTGTGLLSMMAAALGADSVTACEAFKPMAECARKGIKRNGFADKIHLIPKRSTEVTVGSDGDMKIRANILITEVFDTELIGEGAIGTFTHAHRELLQEDCVVVPSAANMYVQLVHSEFVRRWRDIQRVRIPGCEDILPPQEMVECSGAPSLHDLQLDQLSKDQFEGVSTPVKVFRFDFSGKTKLPFKNQTEQIIKSQTSGTVDSIFLWWDLEMDTEGDILLSCAPRWAHPHIEDLQWRDHWMQAIYYPSIPLAVNKGQEVKVISFHDEYSLWFDVEEVKNEVSHKGSKASPVCSCGAHICFSRSRLGMMNDPVRRHIYIEILKKHISRDTVCLCLGDGSLLALYAARLGARKVYTVETNPNIKKQIDSFIKRNNLEQCITVISKDPQNIKKEDLHGNKIDLVIGEPHFQSSVLPWHHIYFWFGAKELKHLLSENAQVLPSGMKIKAIAVEFKDLWKIRAPVGVCEGFNLQDFDDLIETSSDIADANIEPQPLWEYPCRALSEVTEIYDYKYNCNNLCGTTTSTISLQSHGTCHGAVLWAEYEFDKDNTVCTGLRNQPKLGEQIHWDYYSRQGVHLFKHPVKQETDSGQENMIDIRFTFSPDQGELNFNFTQYTSS